MTRRPRTRNGDPHQQQKFAIESCIRLASAVNSRRDECPFQSHFNWRGYNLERHFWFPSWRRNPRETTEFRKIGAFHTNESFLHSLKAIWFSHSRLHASVITKLFSTRISSPQEAIQYQFRAFPRHNGLKRACRRPALRSSGWIHHWIWIPDRLGSH
jgi:hypothetical protein